MHAVVVTRREVHDRELATRVATRILLVTNQGPRWIATLGDSDADYLLLPLYDLAHRVIPGDGHPLAGQQVGAGDQAQWRIGAYREFIKVKV